MQPPRNFFRVPQSEEIVTVMWQVPMISPCELHALLPLENGNFPYPRIPQVDLLVARVFPQGFGRALCTDGLCRTDPLGARRTMVSLSQITSQHRGDPYVAGKRKYSMRKLNILTRKVKLAWSWDRISAARNPIIFVPSQYFPPVTECDAKL